MWLCIRCTINLTKASDGCILISKALLWLMAVIQTPECHYPWLMERLRTTCNLWGTMVAIIRRQDRLQTGKPRAWSSAQNLDFFPKSYCRLMVEKTHVLANSYYPMFKFLTHLVQTIPYQGESEWDSRMERQLLPYLACLFVKLPTASFHFDKGILHVCWQTALFEWFINRADYPRRILPRPLWEDIWKFSDVDV